jgi:replication factor C subunit 3/5
VRQKLYELLSHCIPADIILQRLIAELFPKLDSNLKTEVAHWAAFYEHRLQMGNKEIYHLEGFVAKFMSILLQ